MLSIAAIVQLAAAAAWLAPAWGDTPAAVARAAGPDTIVREGPSGSATYGLAERAIGMVRIDERPYQVRYYFDRADRLLAIKLTPTQPDAETCRGLLAAAGSTFGPTGTTGPSPLDPRGIRTLWRDRARNRFVLALDMPWPPRGADARLCHVTVQPYGDGKPGDRKWRRAD